MIKLVIRQTRNPQTQATRYYAAMSKTTPLTLQDITVDIERMCTVNSADIKAVLDAMQTVIITKIKDGQSVRLGDLGSFRPTVSSISQATPDLVKLKTVRAVRCRFTQSSRISRELMLTNVSLMLGKEQSPAKPQPTVQSADTPPASDPNQSSGQVA